VAAVVQAALGKRGYHRRPIDGLIGPASGRAIRCFAKLITDYLLLGLVGGVTASWRYS
jgi:hypothetical protein